MVSVIQCIPSAVSTQPYPFSVLDPSTREHANRVARYSIAIGECIGLGAGDLDQLCTAALWHDIGKIAISPRLLEKPGRLSRGEFAVIERHPVEGTTLMRPFTRCKNILAGIELHHERLDGSGYPYGLIGNRIPMVARIIAVADTFDAITTNRPYQTARSRVFAVERIRSLADSQLDARAVAGLETVLKFAHLFTEQNELPN